LANLIDVIEGLEAVYSELFSSAWEKNYHRESMGRVLCFGAVLTNENGDEATSLLPKDGPDLAILVYLLSECSDGDVLHTSGNLREKYAQKTSSDAVQFACQHCQTQQHWYLMQSPSGRTRKSFRSTRLLSK
jgi:hypothetical protein